MFSKKLKNESIDELQIKIKHLEDEVKSLIHEVQKHDGYIRSIRGAVNRIKHKDVEEEDIKTSDPTDFLRKL